MNEGWMDGWMEMDENGRGVVTKSQTWRGVLPPSLLRKLLESPNPNKQNNHLTRESTLQPSYFQIKGRTNKQKKKNRRKALISYIINHNNSYIHNLLRSSARKVPLSETSDFTLQFLPITSPDSDLPPSPTVSGRSSSTFLYSFSAAHPQSPPP